MEPEEGSREGGGWRTWSEGYTAAADRACWRKSIENENFIKVSRTYSLLQENLLISSEYTLLNITALGLRPDPHPKHTLQLNYIYLLARYHIWKAKLEETAPNFVHFLRLVKSRFTIETTASYTKKWTPLADCL